VPRKTSEASFGEAKKQRPLIRYAGSAAETSIGSKPIGSELSAEFYSWRSGCQVRLVRHSQADLGKVQRLLGYAPTHQLAEGVAEAMAWYVAQAR
jgi:nucleoside-diphosphate-sugar epimerase